MVLVTSTFVEMSTFAAVNLCSCRNVVLKEISRSPRSRRVTSQTAWSPCTWLRMFSLSRRLTVNDGKDGGENRGDSQPFRKPVDDGGSSSSDSSSGSDTDTETRSQPRKQPRRMVESQKSEIPQIKRKQLANLVKKIKSAQDSPGSNKAAYRDNFLSFQDKKFDQRVQSDGDRYMQDRSGRYRDGPKADTAKGRGNSVTLEEVFSGKPYGYFTEEDYRNRREPVRTLFDTVAEEEYNASYKQLPQSAFDEQIQWTREGKMWQFPIDNEQDWEEEKKYSFQDHVFFDEQLKNFPKKGPIRHFMEVVTNALAKNHSLSVEEKHETIEWYRNYFMEHEELLLEKFGEDGIIKQEEKS